MKISELFKQSMRMSRREWSSGEYKLTVFALVVGVTAVMSLSLTASRIERAMFTQAADLIGGDLVVTSSNWTDDSLRQSALDAGLVVSLSVSTLTMVGFEDRFLLSSLRAVDDNYPLIGRVTIKANRNGDAIESDQRPEKGTVWAEKRLLDRLELELGNHIEIGSVTLKISRILELEPDRGGDFYNFNPRALINWADITESGLIDPASRMLYKLMVTGHEQALEDWRGRIQSQLKANQRLLDPQSSQTRISTNLERASAFINLGSLVSVLLCGIAVSIAAARHARRHINQVALLRCFGLRAVDVHYIYMAQLFLIALPAILLGSLLGYAIHLILVGFLSDFFLTTLPSATMGAWLSGPLTAVCMVFGFGLPQILRLSRVPPACILRRELTVSNQTYWLSALLSLAALVIIAWWQTHDLILAALTVCATALVIAAILILVVLLLKVIALRPFKQPVLRNAHANLNARVMLTSMQITAFGLSTFCIALTLLFRGDLFSQWQQEIPEKAPNRFVFNVLKEDKSQFEALLKENHIDTTLYPIVRGRLMEINGEVVQKAVTKEKDRQELSEEALERDLALAHVSVLPFENVIVEGRFFDTKPNKVGNQQQNRITPVSVESRLAENLDLKLGDRLTFLVEGQSFDATITSLRSVNWENFNPNFYMLFPQGVLDRFSKTWLTSFFLSPDNAELDKRISKTFPVITVIDVDFVLKRIRHILKQVSSAMELIFFMAVLAGIAVFWAALLITFDEKIRQTALLRALGATRKDVVTRFISEQALLGLFAGVLAAVSLVIVSWLISKNVLDISWRFPFNYFVMLPLILVVALSALSYLQLRTILKTTPYLYLQKTDAA